ncbi:acyltransferase family protein, partial [Actinocorallia lasiicapitis]
AVWCVAAIDSAALYLWQLPLVGVAAALLIGALGRGGAPGERLLTLGPVLWIGRVSYPLYLWHWPVWVYLGTVYPGWAPAQRVAVALAASFVLAALTYHLLERPIQRSSPRPRVLLPLAAAGCVALAAVALIPLAPAMDARTDGPVVTGPGIH